MMNDSKTWTQKVRVVTKVTLELNCTLSFRFEGCSFIIFKEQKLWCFN